MWRMPCRRRCSNPSSVTSLVPARDVAQDSGGDPTAPGTCEQPSIRPTADSLDPLPHEVAYLDDQGDRAGALAPGAFVDQAAGGGGGLTAHGPEPSVRVDVAPTAAGAFADPGCGARSEDHQIAPAVEVPGGSGHERVREAGATASRARERGSSSSSSACHQAHRRGLHRRADERLGTPQRCRGTGWVRRTCGRARDHDGGPVENRMASQKRLFETWQNTGFAEASAISIDEIDLVFHHPSPPTRRCRRRPVRGVLHGAGRRLSRGRPGRSNAARIYDKALGGSYNVAVGRAAGETRCQRGCRHGPVNSSRPALPW